MNRLTATASLALVIALVVPASTLFAKPSHSPVRVEYSVPDDVKTGDEVTTVITLRALANLDELEVSVAPFKGVALVSQTQQATFTAVKSGDGPQLTVTVRLTDEKFGSLAVVYRTRQGKTASGGAITIVYGRP